MTKYEFYKTMASKCSNKAVNTVDEVLRKFYQKAEKGFLLKAEKLTLEQAGGGGNDRESFSAIS